MALLSVENLEVRFQTNDGLVHAVNDVSFEIGKGQKLALVGESGSGKSQILFSIMGLLAKNGFAKGKILFENKNLLECPPADLNKIRAKKIAIIFQDSMSALNPYMKIDQQLMEVLTIHERMSGADARKRVLEFLDAVNIPDAKNRLRSYPHELSGGMRQRVMIAMALLCNPELILADEPTTALDVTVQAQIMALLENIQKDFGTAILLITHDLGVVAGFCEEAIVLYGGEIMERALVLDLFERPSHPYTRGLLRAIPNIDETQEQLQSIAGTPPTMLHGLTGCPFVARCQDAMEICKHQKPMLTTTQPIRRCHRNIDELS